MLWKALEVNAVHPVQTVASYSVGTPLCLLLAVPVSMGTGSR